MDLIGKYISVKTKTKDDTFGECIYKITGPVEERLELGAKKFRIKCEMLGGTGPSARKGLTVWDEVHELENAINAGITHHLISETEAKQLEIQFLKGKTQKPGNVIEM